MIFQTRFGNLHYEAAGEGPPLILVHDAVPGESGEAFKRCAKRLAREYQVFSVDLLGFGQSDKPGIEYSAYLFASLINSFIKEVIGNKAVVIARGRGAMFAVMAAALTPANFKKLYLIKPNGMPAKPVSGISRAFFFGADGPLRYSLAKGFLNADYMRALAKIKTPAHIITGGCKLCQKLLNVR